MKNVLLVDDDPLLLKLYKEGLAARGFHVETALDGLEAVRMLHASKPDAVVLDLMMPKLSGVDVLRFIRSEAALAQLPVVVLSNVYQSELAEQAIAIGVQKAFLKTHCSPPVLTEVINELLVGQVAAPPGIPSVAPTTPVAPPPPSPPPPPGAAATPSLAPQPLPHPPPAPPARGPEEIAAQAPVAKAVETVSRLPGLEENPKARQNFLEYVPNTCAGMRANCTAFAGAPDPVTRAARLEDLYRKVRFLTATSGFAQLYDISLLASALAALLFELREKPGFVTPSVLRTMVFSVDFLCDLCARARESGGDTEFSAQVLVVDDDPVANRVVVAALLRAHLPADSATDPQSALRMLEENHYDLVMADVEMPGMDGFELCKRMRTLPGYRNTPVIYVTAHTDFENRARSVLSGGNDLIAKPIFPPELAVKAVTHLLRSRLASTPAPR